MLGTLHRLNCTVSRKRLWDSPWQVWISALLRCGPSNLTGHCACCKEYYRLKLWILGCMSRLHGNKTFFANTVSRKRLRLTVFHVNLHNAMCYERQAHIKATCHFGRSISTLFDFNTYISCTALWGQDVITIMTSWPKLCCTFLYLIIKKQAM